MSALIAAVNWGTLYQVALTVLPVWLFGAITGYLLPRPKWLPTAQRGAWIWLSASGLVGRLALTLHGAIILREVWRQYTDPGTFRALAAACYSWVCGKGFNFELPRLKVDESAVVLSNSTVRDADNWYINDKDLAFFQYHAEQGGAMAGATEWQLMMEKDVPNVVRYTAWRRTLPGGKTEYKSLTQCPDATAQEFHDLYFDDDFRINWDEMVVHHEVVEHGDFSQRQQVVRWIRRFPFSFLSDREYTIARRSFNVDGRLYGLTKAVQHPAAPPTGKVVHMDVFHSMWASHDIPCPWGSGKPACETLLLHHEQFKIPEHLARLAVRVGMWGFVKKMSEEVPKFVAMRRARAGSYELDAQAYGAGCSPNPPLQRRAVASTSSCSLASMASGSDQGMDDAPLQQCSSVQQGAKAFTPRSGALGGIKRIAMLSVLGVVALHVRGRRLRSAEHQAAVGSAAARGKSWRQRQFFASRRELSSLAE